MKSKGFTLLEVMIVLAILGGVIVLAMPYASNRNSQTRTFLRQLTVLSRELHTRAKLQGAVYRLVIDMKAASSRNEKDAPAQQYWVEKSNGRAVIKPNEEGEAMEKARRNDKKEENADPRGFAMDTSLVKAPKELPSPLRFDRVELTRLKDAVTEGKAYIHYLPEGLVDEAAIHIRGDKNQIWTISIHPLTGRAELISKSVSLQEMRSQ